MPILGTREIASIVSVQTLAASPAAMNPSSLQTPSPRAPTGYGAMQGEISLAMSHFTVRYLHFIYRHFDGDITLAIVLGEIAHHNVTRHFTATPEFGMRRRVQPPPPNLWDNLDGCNAFSLSQATGIPRETVRRKITWLLHKGWVAKSSRGAVTITPELSRHFLPEHNVEMLVSFLRTNEFILELLAEGARRETK